VLAGKSASRKSARFRDAAHRVDSLVRVLLSVEPPPCPLVFGGLIVGIMFVYRTVKVKHLKRNEEFKTPAPASPAYI
jgi:hypothetical protein